MFYFGAIGGKKKKKEVPFIICRLIITLYQPALLHFYTVHSITIYIIFTTCCCFDSYYSNTAGRWVPLLPPDYIRCPWC